MSKYFSPGISLPSSPLPSLRGNHVPECGLVYSQASPDPITRSVFSPKQYITLLHNLKLCKNGVVPYGFFCNF